jgi:transcription antitermination factor NusG
MKESAEKSWYVLYTKPRNEKKVAQRLSDAGYEVYCPLQKVKRQWSDRVKVVEEPLFKSYIFIKIEDARREEVFRYPGTVRYLFWLRRPAQVREEEINTIKKWLGEFDHQLIRIEHFEPGDKVRITSGQFMNEEGMLMDSGRTYALVQLETMGIQIRLDLKNNPIDRI